ncbi:hypothetical protein INT45_008295 [Circinella minor]|uniref:Protein-serine/threonine kinase n=1 Tax=Circinella minor TaxID=1195481 RepID=A0A8H7S6T2_9FUNG|nr:hypothetical protein INT45_008295 [Circinella minor]
MATPLQSQIINVLPRRLLASLWASQETRLSLSQFSNISSTFNNNNNNRLNIKNNNNNNHGNKKPSVTTQSFLCEELPIRYSHILRLLSTLTPDQLQTPMIRHVAHRYLHDMCTLLHPSLQTTSDHAFTDLIRKLRTRQAASLIRIRYALYQQQQQQQQHNHNNHTILLDHINTVGLGIQFLTDQHLLGSSFSKEQTNEQERVQTIQPVAIAMQAVQDARQLMASCLGQKEHHIPTISIQEQPNLSSLEFIPQVLYRMLFESTLLTLRARLLDQQQGFNKTSTSSSSWRHVFNPTTLFNQQKLLSQQHNKIHMDIFNGPTSIGFRLTSPSPLLPNDLNPDIPRDPLGIPTCASLLSRTEPNRLQDDLDLHEDVEWHVWSGWRAAKALASHWGGNLDVVSVQGLGSTLYLALDRDPSLLERYPSKRTLNWSAYHLLHHHRRMAAIAAANNHHHQNNGQLSLQAAQDQFNAFLNAISSESNTMNDNMILRRDDAYHNVSLSAAVAAAVAHG